jgi:hypothetical protein
MTPKKDFNKESSITPETEKYTPKVEERKEGIVLTYYLI